MSDFTKLQPYKYEPCASKESKRKLPGKESSDSQDTNRIGITPWCSCGKSKRMATHAESVCCLDKYEIRGSYFKVTSFVFEIFYPVINRVRLLLKSFWELPCQLASVTRTQEEWLLLVISVIYLPSTKPRKLLWRNSILNANCNHMVFLFKKFFKAETACRVTAFVSEIFNLLIIGFYLLHICNSYRPNRLTDLLKLLCWYNGSNYI